MLDDEREGRDLACDIILESVKDSIASIVERFSYPHNCWQHLGNCYKPKGGFRRLMLLESLSTQKRRNS